MRQPRTRIAALRTKKPAAIHRSVRGGSRSSCGRSGRGSPVIVYTTLMPRRSLQTRLKARSPDSSSVAQRRGGGPPKAVEGASPRTALGSAPSTMLRMVPLPRFAGEESSLRPRDADRVRRRLGLAGVEIEPDRLGHHLHRLPGGFLAGERREQGGAGGGVFL